MNNLEQIAYRVVTHVGYLIAAERADPNAKDVVISYRIGVMGPEIRVMIFGYREGWPYKMSSFFLSPAGITGDVDIVSVSVEEAVRLTYWHLGVPDSHGNHLDKEGQFHHGSGVV
jgi:hypothetical protein